MTVSDGDLASRRAIWAVPGAVATALVILLILILAAALRFGGIDAQSLWHDEGNSYVQATRGFGEIAFHAGRDIHPPGYYWILAGWRALAGDSELSLRLPSAFASILTVAFAAALGWRLYGPVAGVTAGVATTLSTFSIYYAQEARMYALLALWVAASFWTLSAFLRRPTIPRMLALAAINTAGLYTQYAFPLFMVAQGVVALAALLQPGLRPSEVAKTGRFNRWLLYIAANAVTLSLFLPWLPTAWAQITAWPRAAEPVPAIQAFAELARVLLLGLVPTANAPAIAFILLLFGAVTLRGRSVWRWLLPIAWTLLPLLLFIGLGLYQPDDRKLMLPAQVGAALWLGRGVWMLWSGGLLSIRTALRTLTGRSRADQTNAGVLRWMRLAALLSVLWLAVVLAEGLGGLRTDPAFQRADYRGIAAAIDAQARPGDAVILDAPNQQEVFGYYFGSAASDARVPVYPLPDGLNADDADTRMAVEAIIQEQKRIFAVFWGELERDPNRVVEKALEAGAFEIRDDWYGDVRLVQYATPADLDLRLEVDAQFGEAIHLVGASLPGRDFATGDVLQVALEWRADAALDERYKVFVQLLNPDGTLAAQRDSEPGGGLALTTTWVPGEMVVDRHALALSSDLSSGEYTLIVGLYQLAPPHARLTVEGGDSVSLGSINVRSQ
ncbi:MAG: glycosyltransferase family 39 protein [Chloroflexi bacterium]|nr:glycosyltransferase family 39 protein [Chloroflexota bacterium]